MQCSDEKLHRLRHVIINTCNTLTIKTLQKTVFYHSKDGLLRFKNLSFEI